MIRQVTYILHSVPLQRTWLMNLPEFLSLDEFGEKFLAIVLLVDRENWPPGAHGFCQSRPLRHDVLGHVLEVSAMIGRFRRHKERRAFGRQRITFAFPRQKLE